MKILLILALALCMVQFSPMASADHEGCNPFPECKIWPDSNQPIAELPSLTVVIFNAVAYLNGPILRGCDADGKNCTTQCNANGRCVPIQKNK